MTVRRVSYSVTYKLKVIKSAEKTSNNKAAAKYSLAPSMLQYFFVVNLYQRCIGIFDRSYSLLLCIHTQTVTTYMKCQNYRRNWYKLTTKNYWSGWPMAPSKEKTLVMY